MPTQLELKNLARHKARETLARSAQFSTLTRDDQFATYQREVQDNYSQLARQHGLVTQASLARQMAEKASDMIDDKRHENRRIEQAGELAGDFVQQVDFPGFVKDLLKGVFDANLQVTLAQMDKYIELMKAATASISKFVNAVDDAASFGYLAENDSDNFSLSFDDDEKDEDGQPKQVLTDKDGNVVAGKSDTEVDAQIKAKIMDAKIAMAKEQRALLRETILMGVSRLVVERGNVKASVIFDFKATEKINKADKAALSKQKSTSSSFRASGGLIGSIFGGPEGGTTRSTRETRISVSSAKSEASTSLSAKLMGSVDITFKSDYFKLDNFASMYADIRNQAPAVAGGAQGAAPAAPTPVPALPAVPGTAPR
jgi:hypothetical protein